MHEIFKVPFLVTQSLPALKKIDDVAKFRNIWGAFKNDVHYLGEGVYESVIACIKYDIGGAGDV